MSNYVFRVKKKESIWDIEDLLNFCVEHHSRNFKSHAKYIGLNVENEPRIVGIKRLQELIIESNLFNSNQLPKDDAPFIIKDRWKILEESYSNEIKELFWAQLYIGYNTWAKILGKKELPVLELDLEVETNHPDMNFDFHRIGRDYRERSFLIRLIHDIYFRQHEVIPDEKGEQNPFRKWFAQNNIDYFDIKGDVPKQLIIGYSKGKNKKSKDKEDYRISTTYKVLIHPGWFRDKSLPEFDEGYYDSFAF